MSQVSELRGAVLGKGYRLDRRVDDKDESVYEATHERIPGHFIIRLFPTETLLQPESSSRIQRGSRVASLLRTPHAVQTLDFNASGEMPAFVVMERNPGQWLTTVLADEGRLPFPRAIDLVESIATALVAGHQMGLVHGDVRPALVLLPESGAPQAKLAGFGWGKEWRAAARLPAPSNCLAPEQHYGKVLTIDERVDQFGLAALTYQMIAGSPPFSEDSADLAQMLGGLRPPPAISELVPGVPQPLDEILRRALSFTAAERFASVQQLVSELQRVRAAGESRSRATTPAQPLPGLAATAAAPAAAFAPATRWSVSPAVADEIEPADADDDVTADINIEDASEDVKLVLGPRSAARADDDTPADLPRAQTPVDGTAVEAPANGVRREAAGSTPRRGLPTGRPLARADQSSGDSSGRATVTMSSDGDSGSARSGRTGSGATRRGSTARRGKTSLAIAIVVGVAGVVVAGALLLRLTHDSGEPALAARESQAGNHVAPAAPAAPAAPTTATPPAATAEAPRATEAPPAPAAVATTETPTSKPAAAAPPSASPAPPAASTAAPERAEPSPTIQAPPVHTAARRGVARPPGPMPTRAPASDTTVPRAAAAAPTTCAVHIVSKPWAQVWLDGKNTGRRTPVDNLKVPCGTRKLELKRPDKGIEQMEMLKVVPGKPYQGHYELE